MGNGSAAARNFSCRAPRVGSEARRGTSHDGEASLRLDLSVPALAIGGDDDDGSTTPLKRVARSVTALRSWYACEGGERGVGDIAGKMGHILQGSSGIGHYECKFSKAQSQDNNDLTHCSGV